MPIGPGTIGLQEIAILLALVALLFGARKIPELMKGFGQGLRELRQGLSHNEDDDHGE